jgi:hypothetical protein
MLHMLTGMGVTGMLREEDLCFPEPFMSYKITPVQFRRAPHPAIFPIPQPWPATGTRSPLGSGGILAIYIAGIMFVSHLHLSPVHHIQ